MTLRHRAQGTSRILLGLLGAAGISALLQAIGPLTALLARFFPDLPRGEIPRGGLGAWELELGLLAGCLILSLEGYLRLPPPRLRLTRSLAGLLGALAVVLVGCHLGLGFGANGLVLPYGLLGLWVTAQFGFAAGLLSGLSFAAAGWLTGLGQVGLVIVLLRSIGACFFFRRPEAPRSGVQAALISGALAAAGLAAGSIAGGVDTRQCFLLALGGVVEGVLFWWTRGFGERLLGFVSRERLHELLDLDQPLLVRMAKLAPGSFEHSRAMANLAEQAASAIGADALLTRVGAYYHDLGKSFEPTHFVENLPPGTPSPHELLSPRESARKIVEHVPAGVELLRASGIPEPVVEFAYTHHGTQLVEYFLNKERQRVGPEERVNEELFRYPGSKPQNRETAILMLVDSIEAASRTVEAPEREKFYDLVRRIVFAKLTAGQLDEAGLCLSELRVICERTVDTLVHMHHHRIRYPWQEELRRKAASDEARARAGAGAPVAEAFPQIAPGGSHA